MLARKGRSLLTMLGIVIGVAGVIIIISLGAGGQSLVLGQVTKLGSNLLSVQPGKSNENGPPAQVFGIVVTTLTTNDSDALRDKGRVPHAVAVNSVVQGSGTVIWGNRTVDTNFTGTDYEYPLVNNFSMQAGQFIDQQQENGNANVAVLGSTVVESLFAGSGVDPVGQIIKIKSANAPDVGGVPLRIIGVIEERGSAFFQDLDDQVFLPVTIAQQQLLGIRHLQAISVKVDDASNIDQTIADITRTLKQQHRITSDVDVDFTVRNQANAVEILTTITNALSLFLTVMAAIALLVGGIGILNIMLVTVAERTREIGLRKAVGATKKAVLLQFLYESSVLTLIGGILGIIAGTGISFAISRLMVYLGYEWDFVISPMSVLLAVGISAGTGIIFGLYPAYKASKLDPIDALRYE